VRTTAFIRHDTPQPPPQNKKEIPLSLRDADRGVGGRAKQDALAERARERE